MTKALFSFFVALNPLYILIVSGMYKFSYVILRFPLSPLILQKSAEGDLMKVSLIQKLSRNILRGFSAVCLAFISLVFGFSDTVVIFVSFVIMALTVFVYPAVFKKA